ncbi:MAG: nuclear transport factor 2 family protein, partial [Aldersonia sp.]|nr:nuclear transport factor 2 family protein [Aldersonia sp.]
MTQTLEPNAAASTNSEVPEAQQRVDAWLADFEAALARRDVEAAAGMFAVDSFWRDLIAFTWNIKTVEGRDAIADMLTARLHDTDPTGFRTTEEPTEADGVVSAWIAFETGVGRGIGHLRLKDEGAWTLLTAMQELKGHEEGKGTRRPQGVRHGADKNRVTWSEERANEEAELGSARQPYV